MQTVRCNQCDLAWTTKGPGHRVFYQYKHDAEPCDCSQLPQNLQPSEHEAGCASLKRPRDAHILDLLPLWISHLDPRDLRSTRDAKYDGTPADPPRFAVFLWGPYARHQLDSPKMWAQFLATLNDLGPRLIYQMSCRHPAPHTIITDDDDPSHGV